MKIILKKDYELLGEQGQIIDVKTGYARNFLIPNQIASSANASNLKTYEEVKKQRGRKVKKETDEAQKLATDLENITIKIAVKTGEDDRVFGSVTSQMIYDELVAKGFETIERKKIVLKEQIKSLGEHEIEVKLQHSVAAKIKVNVVSETNEESSPEETKDEVKEEEKVS